MRCVNFGVKFKESSRDNLGRFQELHGAPGILLLPNQEQEIHMKYALVIAAVVGLAAPAFADEVGVRVGPVGAGVTVGQGRDYDRDHDRNRTTVIKEHEPSDRTTIIKKDHDDSPRTKTIIKERD